MAPWLTRAIEESTGAPVGARNARPTRHRCGAVVLVGLDDDLCALQAVVDPAPLTAAGELAAVLTGRWTYRADAAPDGRRVQLVRRDRWNMRTPPSQVPVLAEHRCGLQLSLAPPAAPPQVRRADDLPPF